MIKVDADSNVADDSNKPYRSEEVHQVQELHAGRRLTGEDLVMTNNIGNLTFQSVACRYGTLPGWRADFQAIDHYQERV